jgi:hypothetical protein
MTLELSSGFRIESTMDPTGGPTIPIFSLSSGHFQRGVLHAFSPSSWRGPPELETLGAERPDQEKEKARWIGKLV